MPNLTPSPAPPPQIWRSLVMLPILAGRWWHRGHKTKQNKPSGILGQASYLKDLPCTVGVSLFICLFIQQNGTEYPELQAWKRPGPWSQAAPTGATNSLVCLATFQGISSRIFHETHRLHKKKWTMWISNGRLFALRSSVYYLKYQMVVKYFTVT